MSTLTHDKLLLTIPVSRGLPDAHLARAATIATRLSLEVTALCPAVSIAPKKGRESLPSGTAEMDELARQQANQAVAALERLGVDAVAASETCTSDLEAILNRADADHYSILMTTADCYEDWAASLTQAPLLERVDVPVWIQNDAPADGIVLGTIALDDREPQSETLDEAVAMHASEIARQLGADAHLLHAIHPESAMQKFAEVIARHDDGESAVEQAEAASAARAHELAESWNIPAEHVHMSRAEFADALEALVDNMRISLVVLGRRHRPVLSKLLSPSDQTRILERMPADLLIVKG